MINILNCGKKNEGLVTMAKLSIALAEAPEAETITALAGTLKAVVAENIGELSNIEAEAFALAVWTKLVVAISDDPSAMKLSALKNVIETVFDGICELPHDKLVEVCLLLGGLSEPKADELAALRSAAEFATKPAVRYAVNTSVLAYLMSVSNFEANKEYIKAAVKAVQSAEQEVQDAVEASGAYLVPLGVR